MKLHQVSIATAFTLGLALLGGPGYLVQAKQLDDADKDKTYYVWCLYEKKLVHKSPYKRKKAEKKAKRHREEMGHGTQLLTEKPE